MSASCASKIYQNLTGDDYVADSISEHSGHPTHKISQWKIVSRKILFRLVDFYILESSGEILEENRFWTLLNLCCVIER